MEKEIQNLQQELQKIQTEKNNQEPDTEEEDGLQARYREEGKGEYVDQLV